MTSFETIAEAQAYVGNVVDLPILDRQAVIGDGIQLHVFSQEQAEGRFTNVYDISYRKDRATPAIRLSDKLTSVYGFVRKYGDRVVSGGGFFFLADLASTSPHQLALNLAAADGRVRSLPVVDREALLSDGHRLWAEPLRSLGMLSLNGRELSWSGSLTTHDTEAKIFGNGNTVIKHQPEDANGIVRVLDERSRLTPAISDDETVDIGFIATDDGSFLAMETSAIGGVDIFSYDVVVRCHSRHAKQDSQMKIRTIDTVLVDGSMRGALSVGPMFNTANFESHPVNQDRSLGGKPPFVERYLARTAIYETEDNMMHIRLFDGRPESTVCPGVTPNEVVESIQAEGEVAWGCFLDSGQTAKLCVRMGDKVESLGNRHYLKWATKPGEKYLWVPKLGRPTASVIALQ